MQTCSNLPAADALATWRVSGAGSTDPCLSSADAMGTASGTLRSYCDTFPASAYQNETFQRIWRFDVALDGGKRHAAYCLEKGLPGPLGDGHRYATVPLAEAFPDLTGAQIRQIGWLLTHTYPAITAAQLFAAAGVNASAAPALDDNDAYAAGQVALWSVFRPTTAAERTFYICGTTTPHPKNARLERTAAYLLAQSQLAATARLDARQLPPCGRSGCRSATVPDQTCLEDCGQQAMTRRNGRWQYGPLRVTARATSTLSLHAACAHEAPGTPVTLTDADGNPLAAPISGEDFFLSFPDSVRANCYTLSLSPEGAQVCAVALVDADDPPHPNRMQTLGMAILDPVRAQETCLCFCCYAPQDCPPCPDCPRCPDCPACPDCPRCLPCPVCPDCPMPPKPTCPLDHPPPCKPCGGTLGICMRPNYPTHTKPDKKKRR